MRTLEAKKIPYKAHYFPDTIRDAMQVAATLAIAPEQVFKTLVLLREDDLRARPLLYMLPADCEVDLRLFAKAVAAKSIRMATYEQAEKLTGLKVGGISALALLNKPFEVSIDQSAHHFDEILVSGGQRGIDIQLAVKDLQNITGARILQATRPKAP